MEIWNLDLKQGMPRPKAVDQGDQRWSSGSASTPKPATAVQAYAVAFLPDAGQAT